MSDDPFTFTDHAIILALIGVVSLGLARTLL
jgi:hypothetical protein